MGIFLVPLWENILSTLERERRKRKFKEVKKLPKAPHGVSELGSLLEEVAEEKPRRGHWAGPGWWCTLSSKPPTRWVAACV